MGNGNSCTGIFIKRICRRTGRSKGNPMEKTILALKKYLLDFRTELIKSNAELLKQQMPPVTEQLFALFEQTGNRLQYETVYFARRKFLALLGLEAILEEKKPQETGGQEKNRKAITEKLSCVIEEICKEECWALPAHVNRAEDPNWRVKVDLFAAETAQTLAELTDRLKDRLPQRILTMAEENIEKRVFSPFFMSEVPYEGWERAEHNWNAVCCGAVGSACLHLMQKTPQRLSGCLKRICEALPYYFRGFAADGTCMEGMGYYNYGMTYFVNFAQELYEYTDGQVDLFCGPWGDYKALRTGREAERLTVLSGQTKQTPDKRLLIAGFPVKCFFADGNSISFSDGSMRECFHPGISSVLGMHYPMPFQELFPPMKRAAGIHADSCYRFAALKLDLLYTAQYLEYLQGQKKASSDREAFGSKEKDRTKSREYILPAAQWYLAGSSSDAGFACKGGHNGEPHNHNDVGHFIYEAGGIEFFTDLGAGEYTKEYFGPGRYRILCNNSFGHSVPIVGGQGQCAGAQYRCGRFEAGGLQKGEGIVQMEAQCAYPEKMLKRFLREFRFDQKSGRLEVRDSFELGDAFWESQDKAIQENLITQQVPSVTGNVIFIKGREKMCKLTVTGPAPVISIKEYQHSDHRGIAQKVYAIQWEVPHTAERADCVFYMELEDL